MRAWQEFLKKQEEVLGENTVSRWLKPLRVVNFDACNLYLEAEDSFQHAWFEEHIRKSVKANFTNDSGKPIKVHLSIASSEPAKTVTKAKISSKPFAPVLTLGEDSLDPAATLEEFLVTPANELTFKLLAEITGFKADTTKLAAPKVAMEGLNPLYLYGEAGSGKTHLLMGVAQMLRKQGLSVLYIRAETFTDHVVAAIRSGAMQEFRKAYRHAGVLIIDDIHILARRSATQEEFFHTFNTLHGSGKQIILSANAPPHLLEGIEPRLISRFEWGIQLHVEKLDLQTVGLWLEKKALSMGLTLTKNGHAFLIRTFHGDTRSLERALHALLLRTQGGSKNPSIDEECAEAYLSDLIHTEKMSETTPDKILKMVASYYGIRSEDLSGKSQTRDAVLPRQMAMYLCRSLLKMPYLRIGHLFSRDHSTVMTSVKQVEEKLQQKDPEYCSAKAEILKNGL